jgi:hypothetical protein
VRGQRHQRVVLNQKGRSQTKTNREAFRDGLDGAKAVGKMEPEARGDALESYMMSELKSQLYPVTRI